MSDLQHLLPASRRTSVVDEPTRMPTVIVQSLEETAHAFAQRTKENAQSSGSLDSAATVAFKSILQAVVQSSKDTKTGLSQLSALVTSLLAGRSVPTDESKELDAAKDAKNEARRLKKNAANTDRKRLKKEELAKSLLESKALEVKKTKKRKAESDDDSDDEKPKKKEEAKAPLETKPDAKLVKKTKKRKTESDDSDSDDEKPKKKSKPVSDSEISDADERAHKKVPRAKSTDSDIESKAPKARSKPKPKAKAPLASDDSDEDDADML